MMRGRVFLNIPLALRASMHGLWNAAHSSNDLRWSKGSLDSLRAVAFLPHIGGVMVLLANTNPAGNIEWLRMDKLYSGCEMEP
jgi:hypothetical protein